MRHHRTLIVTACMAWLMASSAQFTPCPGEPLIFQLEAGYHGTKTWEHSPDGVTWSTVEVVENEPFILQPGQSGWYRVRFHDEDCDISYVSEAHRFVAHAIDPGAPLSLTIGGQVRNTFGVPISGATVRAGCGVGITTTTDHAGVFLLQNVPAFERIASVTVDKPGYFQGHASIVPTASGGAVVHQVRITLASRTLAGSIDGAGGGTVSMGAVEVQFPPAAFVRNGEPYTGEVRVYTTYAPPNIGERIDEAPAAWIGAMDGEPMALVPYGKAKVELTDAEGSPVQLAAGSAATLRITVEPEVLADAPATLPLWWYDAQLGYWVHEGEATLEGSSYMGEVGHFTWWMVCGNIPWAWLYGQVTDLVTGAPYAGALITLVAGGGQSNYVLTNNDGSFGGVVGPGMSMQLAVHLPCGPMGAWELVHTETIPPINQNETLTLPIALSLTLDQRMVTGMVTDCSGNPVDPAYALVNNVPWFCTNGLFEGYSCEPSVNVRGVDAASGNLSDMQSVVLSTDTVDIGQLPTCTPLFGTVTDIEGNVYQTVLIGEQEWMAENLRTSTFANGQPIPFLPDSSDWFTTNSSAWCYPMNDPAYEVIGGKLYNGYAVNDPQGLCPQGWHVSTDQDWMVMEFYLGTPYQEIGSFGPYGSNNLAGKLKVPGNIPTGTGPWLDQNLMAVNSSGFSAVPAGQRNSPFEEAVTSAIIWTPGSLSALTLRSIECIDGELWRVFGSVRLGLSVRCVRD